MERRLIVMRHAKSSWSNPADTDHQRPLNNRGRRDAPRIGQRLAKLDRIPELVLSSDSTRTQQTYQLLCEGWECEPPVRFLNSLYLGGVEQALQEISQVEDELRTLLVLGHNPGWEHLVLHLCGEHTTMKTATTALLRAEAATWRSVATAGAWSLEDVLNPREIH